MSLVDFQASMLDPLYATLGVPAVITLEAESSEEPAAYELTVIDKTGGIATGEHEVKVETLEPGACVRYSELTEKGLTPVMLEGASIEFNGSSWKIKSWPKRPTPEGSRKGELLLLLGHETVTDESDSS